MKTAAAVLALTLFAATGVGAATITYDLQPDPLSPYGGMSETRPKADAPVNEPPFYFTPFAAGSSLTLEFDANGDGTRGDVTIAASQLRINASFPGLDGAESISLDIVGELSGGLGTIIDYGENYPWGEWISWSAPANYSVTGTWRCFGAWCGEHGFATDVAMPYEELLAFNEASVVPLISLGSWSLSDDGSTSYFQSVCHYDYPPSCHTVDAMGTESSADPGIWSAGIWLSGHTVPEPSAALLLAGAFVALALGRRSSGTIRRHEAC